MALKRKRPAQTSSSAMSSGRKDLPSPQSGGSSPMSVAAHTASATGRIVSKDPSFKNLYYDFFCYRYMHEGCPLCPRYTGQQTTGCPYADGESPSDRQSRANRAQQYLRQMDWYSHIIGAFDPRTGIALRQKISTVLKRIAKYSPPAHHEYQDRLYRIAIHAEPSLRKLLRDLNESPKRAHEVMPLRAVRELDLSCFMALSRRPGRNIREKLSDKPYLIAVKRYQSLDLTENRLLKAFVEKLAEMLEFRKKCFGSLCDRLHSLQAAIVCWKRSDVAQAIGRWGNLPPNNTLLSHRHYRVIYDAWCQLQNLDSAINKDLERLTDRENTYNKWTTLGDEYREGRLFAEMPVFFDYDQFSISQWTDDLCCSERKIEARESDIPKTKSPVVAIDLTSLRPAYAHDGAPAKRSGQPFIWQKWPKRPKKQLYPPKEEKQPNSLKDGKKSYPPMEIDLFQADAVCARENVPTIASPDLFFTPPESIAPPNRDAPEGSDANLAANATDKFGRTDDTLNCAARVFVNKIRDTFDCQTIFWLHPDSRDDFDPTLKILRSHFNARFPDAEPLPRSVAAVFAHYDELVNKAAQYDELKKKSAQKSPCNPRRHFAIVFQDTIGGETWCTKLEAIPDPKLEEAVPESHGYVWVRHLPVRIGNNETEIDEVNDKCIPIDEWADKRVLKFANCLSNKELESHTIFCDAFGLIGRDFDQIINAKIDKGDDAWLVTGGIHLYELRQHPGEFSLWKNNIPELAIKAWNEKSFCTHWLVESEDLPLARPRRGERLRLSKEIEVELPAGKDFYQFPLLLGKSGNRASGWSARLENPKDRKVFPLREPRKCDLKLEFEYGADEPYKLTFSFKPSNDSQEVEIIAKWDRIRDCPGPKFPERKDWGYYRKFPGRHGTKDLLDSVQQTLQTALGQQQGIEQKLLGFLVFQTIELWNDGRSISDEDCPQDFADSMRRILDYLADKFSDMPKKTQRQWLWLLANIYKDAPCQCIQRILHSELSQFDFNTFRAVGFALGDLSEPWQKELFAKVDALNNEKKIVIFAFAIWREPNFVYQFTLAQYKSLLGLLEQSIKQITDKPSSSSKYNAKIWCHQIARPMELLLGLLRTRDYPVDYPDAPRIRALLQPSQDRTQNFADHVEKIISDIRKAQFIDDNNELRNLTYGFENKDAKGKPLLVFSYVKLDLSIERSSEDKSIPDLLYALRLYLSGDDGANAIRVTEVSYN